MARRNNRWAYRYNLEKYGLTVAEFRRLGTTPVSIEAHVPMCPDIYPGPARFRKLLAKSPEERRAGVHAWRVRQYEKLCAELLPYNFETDYFNGDPIAVRVTVPAKEVRAIFDLSCVDRVDILHIKGKRRKRPVQRDCPAWYAVKARFVIQYEEQTKGMQEYEERILLVQARSLDDAERKAMREFRQDEMLSLTATGHFFRWAFETILDVYQTYIDKIDPSGVEVYSEMKKRRMKPQYQWHPTEEPTTRRRGE